MWTAKESLVIAIAGAHLNGYL